MSENNFDKHIFDEMSHLRIKPGPHVWGQVQANLRRRRRRRLIGILIPLLFIGSIGAFWILNSNDQTLDSSIITNVQPNTTNDNNSTLLDNNISDNSILDSEKVEDVTIHKQDLASNKIQVPSSQTPANYKTNPPIEANQRIRAISNNQSLDKVLLAENVISVLEDTSLPLNLKKVIVEVDEIKEEADKNISSQIVTEKNNIDTLLLFNINTESIAIQNDSVETPSPDKPKRKWKFGINLTAGDAGVGSGNLSNSIFKSSMVYNSSPGERESNYETNKEELLHRSKRHYAAGFWAAKPITDRLTIQSGLEYQYFSTATNVGWRVIEERFLVNNAEIYNSPLEVYYAPGSRVNGNFDDLIFGMAMPIKSQNFNNYWHFVSLPVQVNYLITKTTSNFGVSVMAGFKYQRLVAEEILHFDEKNGIMFRLDDLVNKNQLMIHSGINLELFKKNKFPVSITPNVGYQVNKFYKTSLNTNHHSWMGGVTIGVQLF